MSMADLLEPARVLANVEARSKKHALEILSELIAGISDELENEQVFEALVERERIGNTGMGKGVAIPHGRVSELGKTTAAFLKLGEAIDYGAQDGEPVKMILAIAVSNDEDPDAFEDVALSARTLADPELVRMLEEASGSRALYELLTGHIPAGNAADNAQTVKETPPDSENRPDGGDQDHEDSSDDAARPD
ncbi:MAG: PTS transporter subunit EIIA [Gammaproteobacteria bacterium]|nr:PTS transporter subunit EIIA [Gammaproteobacteria bacterium]